MASALGQFRTPFLYTVASMRQAMIPGVRLAVQNIRSVDYKWPYVEKILKEAELDVLILTESKHTKDRIPKIKDYEVLTTPEGKSNGVIMIVKLSFQPTWQRDFRKSALLVRIQVGNYRIFVLGAYIPQSSRISSENLKSLVKLITLTYQNPCLIIAGDMNDSYSSTYDWLYDKNFRGLRKGFITRQAFSKKDSSKKVSALDQLMVCGLKILQPKRQFITQISDHALITAHIVINSPKPRYIASQQVHTRFSMLQFFQQNWYDPTKTYVLPSKTLKSIRIWRHPKMNSVPTLDAWVEANKKRWSHWWSSLTKEIDKTISEGQIKEFFNLGQRLNMKPKQLFYEGGLEGWTEVQDFYKNLYHSSYDHKALPFQLKIKEKEAKSLVNHLSRGKALGPDNFPDNVYSKEQLIKWVQQMLPKLCELLPDNLWHVRGILFSKDSSTVRPPPSKTRMIAVVSFALKALDKLFYLRFKDKAWKFVGKYQFGFRPGFSTWDAIERLCTRIGLGEGKPQRKKKFYSVLIDLEKAYDSVDRGLLLSILKGHDLISTKQLEQLFIVLMQPAIVILSNDQANFRANKGVPQGLASSPVLFTVYLEQAIRLANLTCFYQAYADDIVIVADSLEDLSLNFTRLQRALLNLGLKINLLKCNFWSNSSKVPAFETIPCQRMVQYLGVNLASSKTSIVQKWQTQPKDLIQYFSKRLRMFSSQSKLAFTSAIVRGKLIYSALPLYRAGILKVEQINQTYRAALKRIIGIPQGIKTIDLHKFFLELDLGDQIDLLCKRKKEEITLQQFQSQILTKLNRSDWSWEKYKDQRIQWRFHSAFTPTLLRLRSHVYYLHNKGMIYCPRHSCVVGMQHFCKADNTYLNLILNVTDYSESLSLAVESLKVTLRVALQDGTYIGRDVNYDPP